MNGVASFYLPKHSGQALIICTASNYGSGVEVHPLVAIETGSKIIKRAAQSAYWNGFVRFMDTKDLDANETNALRLEILDEVLGGGNFEILGLTGNSNYPSRGWLEIGRWELTQRTRARKLEEQLRAQGRLYVMENPAFEWLRKRETYVDDVFLQTLALVELKKVDSRSPAECEQAYLDSFGIKAHHIRTLTR